MPRALIPIADGSEDIETVVLIDVLRRAGVEVTVASIAPEGRLHITAARGTGIVADCRLDACIDQDFELIALPGGMPGAAHLRDCAPLIARLRQQKQAGKWYAAICASPAVVFAHHGLDTDVTTTAYPSFTAQLHHFRAEPTVVDGHCVTSQGPGTALAFALTLVECLLGAEKRAQVAQPMLV